MCSPNFGRQFTQSRYIILTPLSLSFFYSLLFFLLSIFSVSFTSPFLSDDICCSDLWIFNERLLPLEHLRDPVQRPCADDLNVRRDAVSSGVKFITCAFALLARGSSRDDIVDCAISESAESLCLLVANKALRDKGG